MFHFLPQKRQSQNITIQIIMKYSRIPPLRNVSVNWLVTGDHGRFWNSIPKTSPCPFRLSCPCVFSIFYMFSLFHFNVHGNVPVEICRDRLLSGETSGFYLYNNSFTTFSSIFCPLSTCFYKIRVNKAGPIQGSCPSRLSRSKLPPRTWSMDPL